MRVYNVKYTKCTPKFYSNGGIRSTEAEEPIAQRNCFSTGLHTEFQ